MMVVEISPWSSRLQTKTKLRFAFFRLKIGRFKATVHRVASPYLKKGSQIRRFLLMSELPILAVSFLP
jgi:hypothetical protein